MAVTAWFKDQDNQPIAKSQSAFVYQGFNSSQANPTVQGNAAEAITMGSLGIDGYSGKQVAIPVDSERAGEIKKVTVKVAYDEGNNETGEGPAKLEAMGGAGGAAEPAPKSAPKAPKK